MGDDAEEALDEVGEGAEVVHPGFPEMDHAGVRDDDAAEGDDEGKEAGYEERGEELVRRECRNELSESHVE